MGGFVAMVAIVALTVLGISVLRFKGKMNVTKERLEISSEEQPKQ